MNLKPYNCRLIPDKRSAPEGTENRKFISKIFIGETKASLISTAKSYRVNVGPTVKNQVYLFQCKVNISKKKLSKPKKVLVTS